MSKKIKLAVIRDNESTPCPYGLPITEGCQAAGETIDNMMPLNKLGEKASDEEKAEVIKANQYLLNWRGTGEPCKYAAKLFPSKQNKVDCSYGDTAAGIRESGALLGSPFYSQHFSGISLDGLYSFPLGFFSDYNLGRSTFYGIYSLQGSFDNEDIDILKKVAEELFEKNYNEYDEK